MEGVNALTAPGIGPPLPPLPPAPTPAPAAAPSETRDLRSPGMVSSKDTSSTPSSCHPRFVSLPMPTSREAATVPALSVQTSEGLCADPFLRHFQHTVVVTALTAGDACTTAVGGHVPAVRPLPPSRPTATPTVVSVMVPETAGDSSVILRSQTTCTTRVTTPLAGDSTVPTDDVTQIADQVVALLSVASALFCLSIS